MKKLIFTCLLFVFIVNISKAQFVEIPDENFRNALMVGYPNCFNDSGLMDTTCSEIVNEDSLNVSHIPITTLQGIQYFKNLILLVCFNNHLKSLPTLPSTLRSLVCENNELTSLHNLPSSLENLYCNDNQLTSLPNLPSTLINLLCSYNLLNNLPSLPGTLRNLLCDNNELNSLPNLPILLENLYCSNNNISSLSSLPNSLINLDCSNNKINSLPSLPSNLKNLFCTFNKLNVLPSLPNSLIDLNCSYNQLTNLPSLPNSMVELKCSKNQLTYLPSLKSLLKRLYCDGNQLTSLPALPSGLKALYCEDNQITFLSSLPNLLLYLNCSNNQLTALPALPSSIIQFFCIDNQLTSLPSLPINLVWLQCQDNQLTSLPSLPSLLNSLSCSNNPLNCLPILPNLIRSLDITRTNIKCLPNSTDFGILIDTMLPFCTDPSDICNVNAFAKGFVYNDANNNGIFDFLTEATISNQITTVTPNGWKGSSDVNGEYWVSLDTAINNTWSCNTSIKYATFTPSSYSATPTSLDLLPNNYNFGFRYKPNIKDLEATLVGTAVRPGFTTNIGVTANNIGTVNQSNVTIKLKKPAGYNVTATSTPPTSILNDTLFWKNVSVDFLKSQSFYVELQVPVGAVLGTEIVYEAWVNGTQGDTTPIDNYTKWTEIIRGSFDPNDKLVSKTTLPPAYDVEKDRLIYTIRFQNTGTDTAFYVRVKDEMPANLNLSTLRVINASHAYQLIVREKNIVEFAFPNINLPDKTTNEPKSHGFVQFSIQPKAGLPINTKIENNAAIYFDYNAPIITNFATTQVKLTTGLANNKNLDFKLFPNPTNGILRIELPYNGDGNYILSDISGRQLKADNIANNEKLMELNLNDLPSGTYFITIQLGGNVSTAKIVKL